ncbi:MAG: arylsulfatase [Acidimicrobiales bacterium]|nr:arylsulfatase [Acidimicrobiales bacterium]
MTIADSSSDPTAAYIGFTGEVGRIMSTSTPAWTQPPAAPDGAPNVLIVLVDDLGYSDVGCFGSEIETPHVDRLAAEGIRYANFHVNPMCSPTRASLLTGLNHHLAGVGTVCNMQPGFPGYSASIRHDALTMGEVLGGAGWTSLMVGKWHLCPDSETTEAGPRTGWPLQNGFDRFYGILEGMTNFHQPHRLYEDNHALDIDNYPEDYYFTDDLTERALTMVSEVRSGHPTKPWFLYFSHGAVHAPLQAKPVDLQKYRGRYEAGWDEVRRQRFERQKQLGLFGDDVVLPQRNTEENYAVRAWDELSPMEQELFARYQELYAAMVDNVDQNLGSLREGLEAMGEWENTVVVFTSDNGASREGLDNGTSAYFRTLVSQTRPNPMDSVELDYSRMELLGGPQTLPHYPSGWAMVSGTPFRLYKINTHQGGHQVPFIISKGGGLPGGGTIRHQYQHVTDLLPTLLNLAGVDMPSTKHGRPVPPPAGASFAASLDNPDVAGTHPEQYYEQMGHRGFYRDGWSAVTCRQPLTPFSEERWELHHLISDPTESEDLADEYPEKLAELVAAWEQAAWTNQVFPLDEGNYINYLYRPPWDSEKIVDTVLRPGTPTTDRYRALALINFRSFEVEVALYFEGGDNGTLVAHGDQGGGYALYVVDGRIQLAWNGYGTMIEVDGGSLPPGTTSVVLAIEAAGDLKVHAELRIDGSVAAHHRDLPVITSIAPFQGIDVGIDRRSPVSWSIRERFGTFPWTGQIHHVTYRPGELAPDAGERWLDVLREASTKFE